MSSSVNSVIIFLLFLLSFLCFTTHAADPTYVSHIFPNTTTFSINSTFHSNLGTFLSSLPTAVFYNTIEGRDPENIYGLFLCRGDLSSDTCRDCVNFATRDVTQRCPIEKVAVIWYDECLLRYSNESIYSVLSKSPSISLSNPKNSTNPARFNYEVGKLMNEAIADAVNSPRKFATRNNNISVFETLYGLVQCTPDLSNSDCDQCLREAIARLPNCCSGKIGAQVLFPSCFVWYEVNPFYNQTSTTAPPPDTARPDGKVNATIMALLEHLQ